MEKTENIIAGGHFPSHKHILMKNNKENLNQHLKVFQYFNKIFQHGKIFLRSFTVLSSIKQKKLFHFSVVFDEKSIRGLGLYKKPLSLSIMIFIIKSFQDGNFSWEWHESDQPYGRAPLLLDGVFYERKNLRES